MTRQISRFSIFCIVAAILSAIYLLIYRFVLADIAASNYDSSFSALKTLLFLPLFSFSFTGAIVSVISGQWLKSPPAALRMMLLLLPILFLVFLFGICAVKPLRKPSSVSGSDIKPDGQSVLLFSGSNSVLVWNFKISKDSPEALNFGGIFLFCTDFLFSLSHPFAQSTRKIFYKKQKVLDLN